MGYLATDQAMNTSDPQAPYTVKLNGPIEASTAPLLSDEDGIDNQFKYLEELITACRVRGYDIGEAVSLADESLRTLRKWIASGELMVCKTATMKSLGSVGDECTVCGYFYEAYRDVAPQVGQHCKCGAKIIEAETK